MSVGVEDDLSLFFGANRERLSRYHAAPVGKFCWPGFLFPQAWFLYRKMYGWAALTTAGPFVLERFPYLSWVSWGVSVLGLFGLSLYFRSAERIVAEIRAETADDGEARARIARAGGVSWFGAALGALFIFGAVIEAIHQAGAR